MATAKWLKKVLLRMDWVSRHTECNDLFGKRALGLPPSGLGPGVGPRLHRLTMDLLCPDDHIDGVATGVKATGDVITLRNKPRGGKTGAKCIMKQLTLPEIWRLSAQARRI